MEQRRFGSSGLIVSRLGFGAGQIGGELDEREVELLLNTAVDLGITLVDTARGYGASEERIGRFLAHRRDEIVVSTKGGHAVEAEPAWTAGAVLAGIERALRTLRTDHLDVFHVHSCPRDVLARGEVVQALDDARRAGKVRVAAYSGDTDALAFAVTSELGAIQCSVNLVDQEALQSSVPTAVARGMGVIGKRPLANAVWRYAERPSGHYGEVYWERFQHLREIVGELDWSTVALRFSAFAPGVDSVIVGTRAIDHLKRNAAAIELGPLPAALIDAIETAVRARAWPGQV